MTNGLPLFIPFGQAHIVTFLLVMITVVLVPWLLRRLEPQTGRNIARVIAVVLVVNEIMVTALDMSVGKLSLAESLPLQLCAVSALLTAWMLWQRSYRGFEIVYFWGMGGSIAAMLTPDLSVGFPRPGFIHFFAGHGLIMLGVLHASFAWQFRPTLYSVGKAIIASIGLMLIIGSLNYLLGTNYMYLCAKPAGDTLMDAMGPWPWYLVSLVIAGSAVYVLCYLPFLLLRKRQIPVASHPEQV
jgi:hypothetical integral membrane protein (TIGR02206 family)